MLAEGVGVVTAKVLPKGSISFAYPNYTAYDLEARRQNGVRLRGARAAGLTYERKVEAFIGRELPGLLCVKSLPHLYCDSGGWKRCIPDYLLFDFERKRLCVVEVKLRYSGAAGEELQRLYAPVLRMAWPGWRIQQLEVCKWYDVEAKRPEKVELIRKLQGFVFAEHFPERGVYIWSGRR